MKKRAKIFNLLVLSSGMLLAACTGHGADLSSQNSQAHSSEKMSSSSVAIETFQVTLPSGEGYQTAAAPGFSTTVEKGSDFAFSISFQEGYSQHRNLAVTANEAILTQGTDGYYHIPEVLSDITVGVSVSKNIYTISLPNGEGYNIQSAEGYTTSVEHGSSYRFSVTLLKGYDQANGLEVKANETALAVEDGWYNISAVTEDIAITVLLHKNIYVVTLPTGDGFVAAPANGTSNSVEYDSDFVFSVSLQEGYTQARNLKVTSGADVLTPNADGLYVISHVTANVAVNITVDKNSYSITYPTNGTGYSFQAVGEATTLPTSLLYEETLSFRLNYATGYDQARNLVVTNNGVGLTATDGVYSVVAKDNISIGVQLDPNLYALTYHYKDGNGKDITETKDAVYGAKADLALPDGYTIGAVRYAATGWYDAAENGNLISEWKVTGAKDFYAQYAGATTVSFSYDTEKMSLVGADGSTLIGDKAFATGGTLKFKVVLTDAYSQENDLVIKNGETPLTKGADGYYEVAVGTEKITIVGNVSVNTYSITFDAQGTGLTFAAVSGDLPTSANYGATITFKATIPTDGYYTITANGVALTATDDVYTINNITSNQKISVQKATIQDAFNSFANGDQTWTYFHSGALPSVDPTTKALTYASTVTIQPQFFKDAVAHGFTHVKMHVAKPASVSGDQTIALTHGVTWKKYWRSFTNESDIRIDLNEFKQDDGSYATATLANQTNASNSFVISGVEFFASPSTVGWTKSNTNVYAAYEGTDLVIDTNSAGNGAYVIPSGFFDYFQANALTMDICYKYLLQKNNTRGFLSGWNGAVFTGGDNLSSLTPDADGYYPYHFTIDTFTGKTDVSANPISIGLDTEGTIAIRKGDVGAKVNQTVVVNKADSSDGWHNFSVEDSAPGINYWVDSHGHDTINFTVTTSAKFDFWYGNGNWSGGMHQINNADASWVDNGDGTFTATGTLSGIKTAYAPNPTGLNIYPNAIGGTGTQSFSFHYCFEN